MALNFFSHYGVRWPMKLSKNRSLFSKYVKHRIFDTPDHLLDSFIDFGVVHGAWVKRNLQGKKGRISKRIFRLDQDRRSNRSCGGF